MAEKKNEINANDEFQEAYKQYWEMSWAEACSVLKLAIGRQQKHGDEKLQSWKSESLLKNTRITNSSCIFSGTI